MCLGTRGDEDGGDGKWRRETMGEVERGDDVGRSGTEGEEG